MIENIIKDSLNIRTKNPHKDIDFTRNKEDDLFKREILQKKAIAKRNINTKIENLKNSYGITDNLDEMVFLLLKSYYDYYEGNIDYVDSYLNFAEQYFYVFKIISEDYNKEEEMMNLHRVQANMRILSSIADNKQKNKKYRGEYLKRSIDLIKQIDKGLVRNKSDYAQKVRYINHANLNWIYFKLKMYSEVQNSVEEIIQDESVVNTLPRSIACLIFYQRGRIYLDQEKLNSSTRNLAKAWKICQVGNKINMRLILKELTIASLLRKKLIEKDLLLDYSLNMHLKMSEIIVTMNFQMFEQELQKNLYYWMKNRFLFHKDSIQLLLYLRMIQKLITISQGQSIFRIQNLKNAMNQILKRKRSSIILEITDVENILKNLLNKKHIHAIISHESISEFKVI